MVQGRHVTAFSTMAQWEEQVDKEGVIGTALAVSRDAKGYVGTKGQN